MKKLGVVLALLLFTGIVSAERKTTSSGKITGLNAYDDFNNGDVYIPFETGLDSCPDGVYLSPASPGFKTMVSFALTAYASNKTVHFKVYSDQIWSGSSASKICKVDTIVLQ